jgi:hypothetical protein
MSMHKLPLTEIEKTGLEAHGLPVGKPDQLSDAFRLGIEWANKHPTKLRELRTAWAELEKNVQEVGSNGNISISEVDFQVFSGLIATIKG